jgi:dTDP-4-dehydrorhamnose reductase
MQTVPVIGADLKVYACHNKAYDHTGEIGSLKDKNFNNYGTYNLTSEGETNWHGYACFIASEATKLNIKVKCAPDHIYPILTSEYPTAAKRPLNSRLNCEKIKKTFMLELPDWQSEVKKTLREMI